MTTLSQRNIDHATQVPPPTIDGGYTVGNKHPSTDTVVVGDLNSNAKGSGARKNSGKPQLDLIPVVVWLHVWSAQLTFTDDPVINRLRTLLETLAIWQEGGDTELDIYLDQYVSDIDVAEAVAVFEFGAKKYKAWNWAKGMPWSVPTGCILRHAEKILGGEEIDDESGHSHMGHIVCNLIMLHRYAITYTEGDDRPPS